MHAGEVVSLLVTRTSKAWPARISFSLAVRSANSVPACSWAAFSASSASAPLVAGAQDRLSVLFQIGALLVADPAKASVDKTIEIPVAGVRGDVEAWRFEFRGTEPIETGAGTLSTTHLQRAPRPGTNDRTIDVWVAQSDGGYPARVLYTEPSGNTVMMTLDGIAPMP